MLFKSSFKSYLLVFILLFFSGNLLPNFLFGKYFAIVGLCLTIIILSSNLKLNDIFPKVFAIITISILVISLFQFVILPKISFLAIGNLLVKILMACLIYNSLNRRFPLVLFWLVSWLSIVSIAGFLLINLIGIKFPFIQIDKFLTSYILYGTLPDDGFIRNNGMFWEPGAYAGVLNLCLVINFKNLKYYWVNYRYYLIFIIIALLSTRSTTGYLVGFLITIFYHIKPKNLTISLIVISIIFFIGLYIFQTNDFLQDKVLHQYNEFSEQKIGEFSNTRFGSVIFDLHYFYKHPFIGNGFEITTRFSDHKYMFEGAKGEDVIASGNAISNFLASMGIFFVLGYFFLLSKTVKKEDLLFKIIFYLVVFLNLQAEQWFNFPLYLGLPFLKFFKIK